MKRLIPAAAASFALLASLVLAQEPQYERLNASGKIVRLVPGGVQLATENGDQWSVKLPNRARDVNYSADADVDFLKPEMMVRFSATLSNKGLVLSEIGSIQVFTPLEPGDLGIMPDGGGKNPADGLFSSEEKEEKKPKKGPEQMACNIGGQIVSLKGKKMIVAAGGTQLKCDLADDVKVTVSISDLSWARLGDKVQVDGRYLVANRAAAWANTLSITAANPLVNPKKKPKPTTSKPEEKAAEKEEK